MELLDSITRQDADLGGTFICEKEVTIKFKGEDLKNLHNIEWSPMNGHLTEEQIETVNELLGHILEGVSNYDLV
jgi:hypothetical protein|tara:strand:- start:436 stop:657 length:222 start_codon:yes stop_codon:yes gene_type:complete